MPDIAYSVVIPLFNEEKSLAELQERLHRVMEALSSGYEIIYINDGSTDSSASVLQKLKSIYPKINIISFEKNKGKTEALIAGFKEARAGWIITLDADLQNPPEEIPKLLRFKNKFDLIMGMRTDRKDSVIKKISAYIARIFRWLVLRDVTIDAGCCLRVFKKETVEFFPFFRHFFIYLPFLARTKGFSVKEIPIGHEPRKTGKSKYTPLKMAWQGIFDLARVARLKNRL